MLYVLFTRAKECLIIFDEDTDSRDAVLKLLRDRQLIEERNFDSGIHTLLKEKGTPEQWCTRGHEFMQRGDYANARVCFFRGNDQRNERLAYAMAEKTKAYWLEATTPLEARKSFIEAAEVFVFLGDRQLDAAECFEHGQIWDKAADQYALASRHLNAAKCYKNAKMWESAALAFAKSNHVEDAVDCTLLCLDYDLADQIIHASTLAEEAQTELLSKTHIRFAKAFYADGNEEQMMKHILQFKSKDEQKKFLVRRGCFKRIFELDIANGDYNSAAQALCRDGDYHLASGYFAQGGNHHMAHKCLLKLARFGMYEDNVRIVRPLSSEGESFLGKISLEHASPEALLECKILSMLPPKNIEVAVSLLTITKPYPRLTLMICNSVCSLLAAMEMSSLDGIALSVILDSLLDCEGKLSEVASKAIKRTTRSRLNEEEKAQLEFVCACLEGSLSLSYSDDMLHLDHTTSTSKFQRSSHPWPQAMQDFQQMISSLVEGIGFRIVKVIFRAIMRSDLFVASNGVKNKVISFTDRVELRLKLMRVSTSFDYHASTLLSEDEKLFVRYNPRNVVEELFPPLPSSEDIDKFVYAREALQMSKLMHFSDVRLCDYDAAARMFLIADVTGTFDALLSGEWMKKLLKYLENSYKDRGCDYTDDHRVGLIWSMQYEQAFSCLDFRNKGSDLPTQHCNIYGSVDSAAYFITGQFQYIFRERIGLNAGLDKQELPVSPFHLLAIAERYVCLALFYRKRGNTAMMPRSLAMFVFRRRSRFLGDLLRALHSKREYYHPGQKAFYRAAIKIVDVLVELLSLGQDSLRNWFSTCARLGKGPLYESYRKHYWTITIPAFILRTAQLISTVILNEGPYDDSRNFLLQRFAKIWTDPQLFKDLPSAYVQYLKSLKNGKSISKESLNEFPRVSSQIDDKIVFLTIWSAGKDLPKFVGGNIAHHVIFLYDSNFSDDVSISAVEMLDSKTKDRLAYNDTKAEDEPEPDDVEIQRLPPPPEIRTTRKSFKEKCELVFLRKLAEARKRCASFTPLDLVKRWLEKQFTTRSMRRIEPVVELYVASIAPVLQIMDDITDAIDRFATCKDVRAYLFIYPSNHPCVFQIDDDDLEDLKVELESIRTDLHPFSDSGFENPESLVSSAIGKLKSSLGKLKIFSFARSEPTIPEPLPHPSNFIEEIREQLGRLSP